MTTRSGANKGTKVSKSLQQQILVPGSSGMENRGKGMAVLEALCPGAWDVWLFGPQDVGCPGAEPPHRAPQPVDSSAFPVALGGYWKELGWSRGAGAAQSIWLPSS